MKFSILGEFGYVNTKERLRIDDELMQLISQRVANGLLAEVETELHYSPTLIPEDHLDQHVENSHYSREEDVIYCCPVLDYDRYKKGNAVDRRAVVFDGLWEAEAQMRRANFTEDQIKEYLCVIEDAKQAAIENAPKVFLLPHWLDTLRTLARR